MLLKIWLLIIIWENVYVKQDIFSMIFTTVAKYVIFIKENAI